MGKIVGWLAVVIFVSVLMFVGLIVHKHSKFQAAYGVDAPYFMDEDERRVLQPLVAETLNAKFTTYMATLDKKAERPPEVSELLEELRRTREEFNDASSSAADFGFDATAIDKRTPKKEEDGDTKPPEKEGGG